MRLRPVVVLVPTLVVVASFGWAQFRRGGDSLEAHLAKPDSFDGRFHYCRAVYRPNPRGDGGSWLTDYPLADIDLSVRVSELTKIAVSFDGDGQPRHLIVRLTDDELFQCPVILMQEVGRLFFTADEAARLRTYLQKGGFLWVDDFWGTAAWNQWSSQIKRVLPEFPIVDIAVDDPIRQAMFSVNEVKQVPSIFSWGGPGSDTRERGEDSPHADFRAIADSHGRIMVAMTHNTDIGDSMEREGDDPNYFALFSPDGYALAMNIVLYALTH